MRLMSILRGTVLLYLTYTFMLSVIFLNGTNGIINDENILTDGKKERKYLQRKYNEMYIYKIKIYLQKKLIQNMFNFESIFV